MTISFDGTLASSATKSAGTTLTQPVGVAVPAGKLVLMIASWDNAAAVDGASTQVSASDSQGNTWTKLGEWTAAGGAANAGVTVAAFCSVLRKALGAADTITTTSSSTRTARSMEFGQWTITGNVVHFVASAGAVSATAVPGTVALSGLATQDWVYIWLCGIQTTAETPTPPTGYSNNGVAWSSGGPAGGDVQCYSARKITSQTNGDSPDSGALVSAQVNAVMLFAMFDSTPTAQMLGQERRPFLRAFRIRGGRNRSHRLVTKRRRF